MAQAIQQTQYAGEFQLETLKIYSPSKNIFADLSKVCIQIDVFESIFTNAITAQLVIIDTENIIDKLPIIGQEYVEIKCSSPGANSNFNTLDFTGNNRLFVSKVVTKEAVGSGGALTYALHLITNESLINLNTRVSKSYTDDISSIVRDLLKNQIGTSKKLNIELTSGIRKIVSPNSHPYTLINNLKRECISSVDLSPHFLFFENKNGFNFLSLQTLFSRAYAGSLHAGDKILDEDRDALHDDDIRIMQAHKRIIDFNYVPNKSMMTSLMSGMLGSTLITHDIYNKNYSEKQYNYFNEFKKFNRIESNPHTIYSETLRDDFGSFKDSVIKLHPTSTTTNNKDAQHYNQNNLTLYESNRPQNWIQQLDAKRAELENTQMINMTIHGNSLYTVGDMVELFFPITGQDHDRDEVDFSSGNYLISKLRHSFTPPTNNHVIHMSAVRDCNRIKV